MNKGLRRCGVFFCGYGEKARRPSHKLEETIKRPVHNHSRAFECELGGNAMVETGDQKRRTHEDYRTSDVFHFGKAW